MSYDFSNIFNKYKQIVHAADSVFERLGAEFPDLVTCKAGCSDCCHALFDLTMVEAIYINHKVKATFKGKGKEALLEKANKADRKVYKIKRSAYTDLQNGKEEAEILGKIGMERVRCPLLNDQEQCDLYRHRPITCRIYGLPMEISGMSHTCGKTGFKEGEKYPTVHLDKIQQQLYAVTAEMVQAMQSKYVKIADMLVPLSMAILTVYDDEYLGIKITAQEEEEAKE